MFPWFREGKVSGGFEGVVSHRPDCAGTAVVKPDSPVGVWALWMAFQKLIHSIS